MAMPLAAGFSGYWELYIRSRFFMWLSSISCVCAADKCVSETIATPICSSKIRRCSWCHLCLRLLRLLALVPFILKAASVKLARVFLVIFGLPVCCLRLFFSKKAGACSSSRGQPGTAARLAWLAICVLSFESGPSGVEGVPLACACIDCAFDLFGLPRRVGTAGVNWMSASWGTAGGPLPAPSWGRDRFPVHPRVTMFGEGAIASAACPTESPPSGVATGPCPVATDTRAFLLLYSP